MFDFVGTDMHKGALSLEGKIIRDTSSGSRFNPIIENNVSHLVYFERFINAVVTGNHIGLKPEITARTLSDNAEALGERDTYLRYNHARSILARSCSGCREICIRALTRFTLAPRTVPVLLCSVPRAAAAAVARYLNIAKN